MPEILDGEIVASPRPSFRHAAVSTRLGSDLDAAYGRRGGGGPGGWVILDEPELHIAGQILVTDIAGLSRERMPEIPDVAFAELAPDWLCEVLSPSTAAMDRTRWRRVAGVDERRGPGQGARRAVRRAGDRFDARLGVVRERRAADIELLRVLAAQAASGVGLMPYLRSLPAMSAV